MSNESVEQRGHFSDEFIAGHKAFYAGLKIELNPHDPETETRKYNDWRFGWWDAESYEDYMTNFRGGGG